MSLLYITEVEHLARDGKGSTILAPLIPVEGVLAEQGIMVGAGSTPSAPFNDKTRFVMVHTEVACCLGWGPNPVAVVGKHRLGPGEVRFYGVYPGAALAVIATA